MKDPSGPARRGGLFLAIGIFGVMPLQAAETFHVFHFDDLEEGSSFRSIRQPYAARGIRITGTGDTGNSVPTVIVPAPGAGTPPHALINEYAYGSEFGSVNQDVVLDLEDFEADFVSVDVGLAEDSLTGGVTARMTAYRRIDLSSGETAYALIPRGSDSLNLGTLAIAPDPSRSLIVESPEVPIGRLVISYGMSGLPNTEGQSGSRELIDTIVIREYEGPDPPPVEDTTDPVVTITGPVADSTATRRIVPVMGYVDEDLGLDRVVAVHLGRSTTLAFTGMPPRFFFAGFVEIHGDPGSKSIAVFAEDLFGNLDQANVSVEFEPVEDPPPPIPPPPDLDIVACGMEVTQSIQGWGLIGPTPQDVNTSTRTIAGKKTLVRVYAEAQGTDVDIADVRCQLRGFHGADELPGSPLEAMNRVTLVPGETHLEQRALAEKSFNFILPPEWTVTGVTRLLATVNPWNGAGEKLGAFDVYNDVARDVTFHDTEPLCVIVFPFRATSHDNRTPSPGEIAGNVDLLRQCYPVAADRLSIVTGSVLDLDIDLGDDDDPSRVLRRLRRALGFYRGSAIALPCQNTAFVGLIQPGITDVGGITDSRFPVCVSYAGDDHVFRERTAHEVGHAMGLGHVIGCDDPDDPYEEYPTYRDPVLPHTRYPDASIGEWGVEIRDDNTFDVLDPAIWGDLMSYCFGSRWISPYTHDWLFRHFEAGGGEVDPAGGGGSVEPGGGMADVPYLIVNGTMEIGGKATLDPTWSVMLPQGSSDHEGLGPYVIELLGSRGAVLFTRRFRAAPIVDLESHALIDEVVPWPKDVVSIRLSGGGIPMPVVIQAGPRSPVVELGSPVGGEAWPATGSASIQWTASDPDGEPLVYAVFYSNDLGMTWDVLERNATKPGMTVTLDDLRGGENSCLVRVAASDGIHVSEDVSPLPFSKGLLPPRAIILAPRPVRWFAFGKPIVFESLASDLEDGALAPENLRWTSNLDGPIGVGPVVGCSRLRPGLHLVTLDAVDSDGMVGRDTVGVYVGSPEATSVRLPDTGQVSCYGADGATAPCAGTGQDGEMRAGVSWPNPRFAVKGDGTVVDLLTGLVWAGDASTPILFDCKGGAVAWASALSYVECLNEHDYLGHRDWRLPNVIELLSLAHAGEADGRAWLGKQGFTGVGSGEYWSSTSFAGGGDLAWRVNVSSGASAFGDSMQHSRVWPVRSRSSGLPDPRFRANPWKTGQEVSILAGDDGDVRAGVYWPSPRFTDHGNGTVTDNLTGLMWLQHGTCLGAGTWMEALDAVAEFRADPSPFKCLQHQACYRDWRMPNAKELLSLVDFSQAGPALPVGHPFPGVKEGSFWSSTSSAAEPEEAWTLEIAVGALGPRGKAEDLYVWPVRGGESPQEDNAHLALSMTDTSDPVPVGSRVTYTIVVTNYGLDDAVSVRLRDELPLGVSFISAETEGGTCRELGGVVTCQLGDMKRGETVEVVIAVSAPKAPGNLRNTAEALTASNDPNTTDNEAIEMTRVAAAGASPVVDSFDADPAEGVVPLPVVFTCKAHDPDGTIKEYRWDFNGDGQTDTSTSLGKVGHTYPFTGTYQAAVVVADDDGWTTRSRPLTITLRPEARFRRGDVDNDGKRNLADVIVFLVALFREGGVFQCPDAADVDDDGKTGLSDAILLLRLLFAKPPPVIPEPFAEPGVDPTADALPECRFPG